MQTTSITVHNQARRIGGGGRGSTFFSKRNILLKYTYENMNDHGAAPFACTFKKKMKRKEEN